MIPTLRQASWAAAALLTVTLVAVAHGRAAPVRASAAALPQAHLEFGLTNDASDVGWMTSSGVPWRYRYVYLAGGVNTANPWQNWNSPTGAYATNYMNGSAANGYIPVFTYYEMLQSNPSTGSNESDRDFSNLNNASTMNAYYANFKLLMQLAGAFGQTVVVHVEPDLWGYLQQKAGGGDASKLTASVASSGYADVAGIPNTVQGFADALLKLRDLYAANAVLAIHASLWSSGIDIGSDTSSSVNPITEADSTAAFLNSAGVASNAYGSTWDLVFNDVDDHDAGWWEQQGADNAYFTHWWDPTNTRFPNFSRYLSWVSELHARTARPQVVWQVPLGNQYFLTMNNTCHHYQDNITPYFIGHATDLFAAGLIAVLFGAGNDCQTTNVDSPPGDGVTNNGGVPTSDALGGCSACNTHVSAWSDDDGGYIRRFVGQYYAALSCGVGVLSSSYLNWYDKASAGVVAETIHVLNPGSTASSGCVVMGSWAIPFSVGGGQDSYFAFPDGTIGGPVVIKVTSGPAVLASKRSWYYQSFNESWARPASAAANQLYFPWYDLASPGARADTIHITNPGATPASGSITLPGASSLSFSVAPGQDGYYSFPPGTIGGPVEVSAGQPVLARLRAWYYQSFHETPGLPAGAAAQTLDCPWYDHASAGVNADTIHVTNPGATTATGTISLGASQLSFSVPAGQNRYYAFPQGSIGGPLSISSSQPVLASLRAWYYQTFNETPARAQSSAANSQHFAWYDLASPGMRADTIHITNESGTAATGSITLPGASTINFSVGNGQDRYFAFPAGTIGGPVTVSSSQPVLASLRAWYYQSFNEVPGA